MDSGVFIPIVLPLATFATGLSQARRAPAESDPTKAIPASCNRFCKERLRQQRRGGWTKPHLA